MRRFRQRKPSETVANARVAAENLMALGNPTYEAKSVMLSQPLGVHDQSYLFKIG